MNRRDIPGLGFDPGFEPKPFQPQQPPPGSASIFGLISRVNQGVVSQPPKGILKPPTNIQPVESPELQQAKSVAEKITMLTNFSPQSAREREKEQAFLQAKSAVERIQQGQMLLNNRNAPQIKSTAQAEKPDFTGSFRVPELPRVSTGRFPGSAVTGSGSYRSEKSPESDINAVAPIRSIVDYADDDESIKVSGYGRERALEEIDRYMARKSDVTKTDIRSSKTSYLEGYTKEPVRRRFRESKDTDKEHYDELQKGEHEKLLDDLRRKRIESDMLPDSSGVKKVFDYGHSQNFVVGRVEKETEEKRVESRDNREKEIYPYRDAGKRYERYDNMEKEELVDRFSENSSRARGKGIRHEHSLEREFDKPDKPSSALYSDENRHHFNKIKHSRDYHDDYRGSKGSINDRKNENASYDDDYDGRKQSTNDRKNEDKRRNERPDMGQDEGGDSPINWNDRLLFDKQFDEVEEEQYEEPQCSAENVERSSNDFQGKNQEYDSNPRHDDGGFWNRSDDSVNKNDPVKDPKEFDGEINPKGTDDYDSRGTRMNDLLEIENKNEYERYHSEKVRIEFGNQFESRSYQSRDGRNQQKFGQGQQLNEEDTLGTKRILEGDYHQRKRQTEARSRQYIDLGNREMYHDFMVGNKEFSHMEEEEVDKMVDKFEDDRQGNNRHADRNRRPFEGGAVGNLDHDLEKIKEAVSSDFYCKDCSLVCVDESVFDAHLKGDLHLLTLQKKAQELFQIQARTSRFETDKFGNPLKATILPISLITGINTNSLVTATSDVATDRNVFSSKDDANVGPSRSQDQLSSNRVQVIPPKPLGPLEARSIHGTWLVLYWHMRTPAEEHLVGKYVIEYRNARETSWARVGQTNRHEFEVTGLQGGTDYLFRVYSTNGEEKSEMLESVLITTQKRRDSADRRRLGREIERGRRSRSRERMRDRDKLRPRIRSGDHRRSRTPERRRRPRSPIYKRRSRSPERKRSRDSDRSKSKDMDKDQKKDSESKQDCKSDTDLTKADNSSSLQPKHLEIGKSENKPQENIEAKDVPETTSKSEEPVEDRNVECLLYKEFHIAKDSPLLGLEDIYEFHDFNEKIPQHYVCKLCNNKGSHNVIMRHIMGTPHKLAFFKKHYPDLHESISMIAIKKQQLARLNYEGRKIEKATGRGAVKVLHMLNPVDNKGKKKYTKPVAVPAAPVEGSEETSGPPAPSEIVYVSQFEQICQEAEQAGMEDACIVGLDYIKELMHPTMSEECKYSCSLCKSLCGASTIMYHLVGRRHRISYLKAHHVQLWNDLKHRRDLKSILADKIRVLSKKDGRGTLVSKVAQTDRAWRRSNKKTKEEAEDGEPYYEETNQSQQDNGEPDDAEAPKGGETEAPKGVPEQKAPRGLPAIKFGIKKSEPASTVVQPINILDQSPVKKGVFDWNKENSILQDRIQNQSIIKSTRKSKFITVYSGFFQRCPVIGMQWVTEFQKPDVKLEPWFLCFMCQQRLQWKNVLDHVTSTVHRLNYMKKSHYREKYSAIYNVIKTDKARAKSLIEQYSKEIADQEGPPTSVEVMLELNINMEAFKGVSKIQENIKAHSASSSHAEHTSHVTTAELIPPSTVSPTTSSTSSSAATTTSPKLPWTSSSLPAPYPMSTTVATNAPFLATPILDPHVPPILPDMSVPPPGFPRFPVPTNPRQPGVAPFPQPPLSNMPTGPHVLHGPPISFPGSGAAVLNVLPIFSQQAEPSSIQAVHQLPGLPVQVTASMGTPPVFQPPPFVQSLPGSMPASYPPYPSGSLEIGMSQAVTLTSQTYSHTVPLVSAPPPFAASTDPVTIWQDVHPLPSNHFPEALPGTSASPWHHTENKMQQDMVSGMKQGTPTGNDVSGGGQTYFSSQNVSSEFDNGQPSANTDKRYSEHEQFASVECADRNNEYNYDGKYDKYKDSHGYDPERPGFDRGEKRKYESSGYSRDTRRRQYDRGSRSRHDRHSESPGRKDREVYSRHHSRSRSPESRYRNDRDRDRQRSYSPHSDRSRNVRYARYTEHEVLPVESYYSGQDVDNELNEEQLDMLVRQYSDRHDDFDDLDDFDLTDPDHTTRKGSVNDDVANMPERQVRYVGKSTSESIPDTVVDDMKHSYRKVEKTADRSGLAVNLKIETVNDRYERDIFAVEIDRKDGERRGFVDEFIERRVETGYKPRSRQGRDRDVDTELDSRTDHWKSEDRMGDRDRGRDLHDDDRYHGRRRDAGFQDSDRHRGLGDPEMRLRRQDREKPSREEIDALLQRAAEDLSPSHVQPEYIDRYDYNRGLPRDPDRNQSRDTHRYKSRDPHPHDADGSQSRDAQRYQSRDTHRGQSRDIYGSDRYDAREGSRDDSDFNLSAGFHDDGGSYPSDRGRDDTYRSRYEDRSRLGEIRGSRERDSRSESGRYSGRETE